MSRRTLPQRLRAALGVLFDATNYREIWRRPLETRSTGDIKTEVNPTDRLQLLSDSRKLYANLGPCKGAIDAKGMYAVGRSWLPRFDGADKAWGATAREWLLNEFYPIADIGGGDFQTALFLLSVGVDRDGDCGALLTNYDTGFPAIQLVPGNAIGSRKNDGKPLDTGLYKGLRLCDGAVLNAQGRAVAYLLLGDKSDGSADEYLSARDLAWLMEPQFIGQARGLPGFSSSILDLNDLRTTQGYEKMACALASSIGLLEYNETGLADASDPAKVLSGLPTLTGETVVTEMGGGTWRHYKAASGQKLEAFKNDRPGEAWQNFMDRLLRNAMAGINWPYELAWDISKLGGANTRFIIATAMRSVEDRQDLLRPFAKRAVGYACAKAIKQGILEPSDDWWRWGFTMPPRMTADFGRDAAAQREDYLQGIINLTDICAERGEDLDTHIAERAAENAKLAAAGLPLPMSSQQVAAAQSQQQQAKADSAQMGALESRPAPAGAVSVSPPPAPAPAPADDISGLVSGLTLEAQAALRAALTTSINAKALDELLS